MTIHTFEVSSILTSEDYYKIQSTLKELDKAKWQSTKYGMIYWGLSDKGIIVNFHIIKKKDYYSYRVIYRISAQRVIDNDDFVGLFNTNKYFLLEEAVNELLYTKSPKLPKLKNCKLKRLDFCVNAELDNQKQVKAYIRTVKRGNIPKDMKLLTFNDEVSKRYKPSKNDFTVYSENYIGISIYNKYKQMKQHEDYFPQSEIKRAANIVRIEIRCMENKLKALKKKYDIKTISQFMDKANKIGNELFVYYLTKIFGTGTVYTLKEAAKRISDSGFKEKTAALLKELIQDSNEAKSAATVIKEYKNIYGKSQIQYLLSLLNDIDTNYVTITVRDAQLFDNCYFPTPLELYNEFK